MAFDWKDYLSLAEELSLRSEESARRSAVSRAYYAAFCSARNHLKNQGTQISFSEDSHKIVWESFQKKGKTYAAIYQNGNRLKNARRHSDYEDEIRNLSDSVAAALKDAKTVFYWLEKLDAEGASS